MATNSEWNVMLKSHFPKISIDFSKKTFEKELATTSISSYLIFLFSVSTCLFFCFLLYSQVSHLNFLQLKQKENDLRLNTNKINRPIKNQSSLTKAKLQLTNQKIQHLNFPWSDFFDALEDAEITSVSLISLDASNEKNTIKIVAEGKDQSAIFDYVNQIKKNDFFKNVRLIQTEVNNLNPEKPIRFQLEITRNSQ
jgi:hypothetical protein